MDLDAYFTKTGQGESLVFIHGSFATDATWKKFVEEFSDSNQCITIKLPGHGGAPEPTDIDKPSEALETEIIESIVKQHCDTPVHLIGHSYGAVVALNLALRANIDIAKLTLFEPVAVWTLTADDYKTVDKFLTDYRSAAQAQESHACKHVIDFWGGNGAYNSLPENIQANMQPMTNNNLRHWQICTHTPFSLADLQQIDAPTHLVRGDQSNLLIGHIMAQLATHIPNCSGAIIHGASHFLVNSHSTDCIHEIK